MKYIKKLLLTALLFPIIADAVPAVGININKLTHYSSNEMLLNKFKSANGWIPQRFGVWDTGEQSNIPVDSDGWVTKLDGFGKNGLPVQFTSVSVLLNRSFPAPFYKSGNYVILYDGEGNITCGFDCSIVSKTPGKINAKVTTPSANGILLTIATINPANYVRNIRVVHADDEAALAQGQMFNRTWLRKLEKFTLIRSMDLMSTNCLRMTTNCNPIVNFADRPKLTDAFWGTNKGLPIEVLVAITNDLKADLWFNAPISVSDNYVDGAAKLIKSLIKFNSKVYFELSNEIWNSIFTQSDYAAQQANIAWPNNGLPAHQRQMIWYGMRTAQMCPIFKSAFDVGQAKCVMSGQAVNIWHVQQAVNCSLWANAPCDVTKGIDLVSLAPYFNSTVTTDLNTLFNNLMIVGIPAAIANTNAHVAYANSKGMGVILYEAGQHLLSTNTTVNNLYIQANRDSRIGQMYTQYLNGLNTNSIEAINLYYDAGIFDKSGSWGLLENINQTTSPKYNAVINFIN